MELKSVSRSSDKNEVTIILSTSHIESVNNLYRARVAYKSSGKKKVAYPVIYKSPEVLRYINEVSEQLDKIDFRKDYPWIFESDYFDVTVQFVMNKSFNSRDLDNCLKIMTDALFGSALGLNDSRIVSWKAWKSYLPESPDEYIMIKLERSNFNFMFSDLK